jgi:hypothetical protein
LSCYRCVIRVTPLERRAFIFFERGHLQAQIIDPTNFFMFTGSELTHTLQVLESMEKAGITDREFLATTLIHDLGKLASLKGEKWENLEGGGKIPQGENVRAPALKIALSIGITRTWSMHVSTLMCPRTWRGC